MRRAGVSSLDIRRIRSGPFLAQFAMRALANFDLFTVSIHSRESA